MVDNDTQITMRHVKIDSVMVPIRIIEQESPRLYLRTPFKASYLMGPDGGTTTGLGGGSSILILVVNSAVPHVHVGPRTPTPAVGTCPAGHMAIRHASNTCAYDDVSKYGVQPQIPVPPIGTPCLPT